MARVTISEAIKLSGVSRSTFYTTYIKQGRITVSSYQNGKKYIDTSELLRVFGKLQSTTTSKQKNSSTEHQPEQEKTSYQELKIELIQVKQRLDEAQRREQEFSQREQWYQDQINNLTDSIKLLETPKHSRLWWQFWK